MSKRTVGSWFVIDVRGVTVRNLYPEDLDIVFETLPHPKLRINVIANYGSTEELTIFGGDRAIVRETCNPLWNISDMQGTFKTGAADAKMWRSSEVLKLTIDDASTTRNNSTTVLEATVNLADLVYLGEINFEDHLQELPFNAIFLTTDAGLWASKETFQILCALNLGVSEASLPSLQREDWGGRLGYSSTHLSDDDDDEEDEDEDEDEDYSSTKKHQQRDPKSLASIPSERAAARVVSTADTLKYVRMEVAAGKDARAATDAARLDRARKLHELTCLKEAVRLAELSAAAEEQAIAGDKALLQDTADLTAHMTRCEALQQAIQAAEQERKILREQGSKVRFLLEARQLKLFSELQSIYPIEPLKSGDGPQQTQRWAIRGLEFPPLDCPARDDEHLATVLGYIVHVVLLLSKYQQISLRYQLLYYSSRSMVRDPTASGSTNQNLPLYRTNTEPERFRKAVLWLAKDIEQILMIKGQTYDRRKDMLFNLHQIFLSEMIPQFS